MTAEAREFNRTNRTAVYDIKVVDDIGNFLRTTGERWDIISADEKTADNYASNGFSFSTDYYALLREHLTERGLAIQWVPNQLPPGQYRSVLATFAGSFPAADSVWLSGSR